MAQRTEREVWIGNWFFVSCERSAQWTQSQTQKRKWHGVSSYIITVNGFLSEYRTCPVKGGEMIQAIKATTMRMIFLSWKNCKCVKCPVVDSTGVIVHIFDVTKNYY